MGIKVIKKAVPAPAPEAKAPVTEQPAPIQKITKTPTVTKSAPSASVEAPSGAVSVSEQGVVAYTAVGKVTKEYKDGSVIEESEELGHVKSSTPMASLHISMGITRNLGNYESVKVSIGITLPCLPTQEDIEDSYTEGKSWVDDKINAINQEITEQIG